MYFYNTYWNIISNMLSNAKIIAIWIKYLVFGLTLNVLLYVRILHKKKANSISNKKKY